MTALVLDAGALIAVDRGDRPTIALLRAASSHGVSLRTHPLVVSQVWRDPAGRQANLARLLGCTEIVPIDEQIGKAAGVLCGASRTDDPIDTAVALITRPGDRVLTSDPDEMTALLATAGVRAVVASV